MEVVKKETQTESTTKRGEGRERGGEESWKTMKKTRQRRKEKDKTQSDGGGKERDTD